MTILYFVYQRTNRTDFVPFEGTVRWAREILVLLLLCKKKPAGKHFIFYEVLERVGGEGGYYMFMVCLAIQVP